jgi:hypothetical protein
LSLKRCATRISAPRATFEGSLEEESVMFGDWRGGGGAFTVFKRGKSSVPKLEPLTIEPKMI